MVQLSSSHPTHKTRKRVKSNYQVSKFILVYPENGTKTEQKKKQKTKWEGNTKSCQGSERNLKTSWEPATMSCEANHNPLPQDLIPGKMICGASALARNAKLKQQAAGSRTGAQAGLMNEDDGDFEEEYERGYPFQHFRFITIIFTLQTFFFCVLFLVFVFHYLLAVCVCCVKMIG